MTDLLLADLALAQRLERAEAHANAAFVEARASLQPSAGATWCDIGGCWAMFDGVGSPLTQTFGLGCFSAPDASHLDALEAFFGERGAAVMHEVSAMADMALLPLLAARGYAAVEWSNVLVRPLPSSQSVATSSSSPASTSAPVSAFGAPPTVRVIAAIEADHWSDVAAAGWGETPELAAFMRDLGRVSARANDTFSFLASLDGEDVAAGALHIHGGVALLAGASTRPDARRRGAQGTLLEARLAHASRAGCDVAMLVAAPGSSSQKNAQRAGFRPVYSRVKFGKPN